MSFLRSSFGAGVLKHKYWQRVKALDPIGFWPLWEPVGTAGANSVRDISGNGFHGTPTNVTFGEAGIGDGRSAGSFNGATSYINIFSPALAAAFNGAEGGFLTWHKVSGAGVWTDGVSRHLCAFQADATNYILCTKHANNNQIQVWLNSGGTFKNKTIAGVSFTDWFSIFVTWSETADQLIVYLNGVAQGAPVTGLGVFAGVITKALLGAGSVVPANVLSGSSQYNTLWDRPPTSTEAGSVGVR